MTAGLRESQAYLNEHQAALMGGASKAVLGEILENERAAPALKITAARNAKRAETDEQTDFRPGAGVPKS